MTQPAAQLLDTGNDLLAQGQYQLKTGTMTSPAGKTGIITVRTASTTLTLLMAGKDVREWGAILTALADQLEGGLAVASPLDIPGLGDLRLPGR